MWASVLPADLCLKGVVEGATHGAWGLFTSQSKYAAVYTLSLVVHVRELCVEVV